MYVIGIDIGTSSTKGILIDSHMNVMAQKSIPHTIERPQAGWAEQDAELWWQETVTIIKSLLTQSQVYPSSVKAIGCSGVCPVIVPIDKDGNSLRQAILYSIDTRATAEIAEMKQIFGEQYILEDSGHPLSYQAILPKMMWVKKNEPDVWKNATSFLGATGFVNYRLSGKTSIDHFTAADGGLGYSIKARKWNKDVFKQLNIDERLFPDIYWPYEKIGTLTKEAAQLTGLIEGISIIAGTGDALSEMISTGVSNVGETSLLYGSTLTTMSIIDDYWFHEGFITVPGWKDGQVVTSAVLGSGMSSFTWLSHLLGKENNIELFNELEPQVVEIQDSNHNIVFLPYLTGLRSPEINPLMKGTIVGIN